MFFHYPGSLTVALSMVAIGAVYWRLYFAVSQADKNRYLADTIASAGRMSAIYEEYIERQDMPRDDRFNISDDAQQL